MNYFIGLGIQGKDITIFGKGEQVRTVTYVDDCVSALIQVAASQICNNEVFFAVSEERYTIAEIGKAIAAHVGGQARFVEWPRDREVIEIGDSVVSNEKIRRVLGWKPEVELSTGLQQSAAYYSTMRKAYLQG